MEYGVEDGELTSAMSHVAARSSISISLITRARDVRFAAAAAATAFLYSTGPKLLLLQMRAQYAESRLHSSSEARLEATSRTRTPVPFVLVSTHGVV